MLRKLFILENNLTSNRPKVFKAFIESTFYSFSHLQLDIKDHISMFKQKVFLVEITALHTPTWCEVERVLRVVGWCKEFR